MKKKRYRWFYARNHPWYISTHKVRISLDHFGTYVSKRQNISHLGMGVLRRQNISHLGTRVAKRLDAHHLGIGISKGQWTDKNKKVTLLNASNSPLSLVFLSPTFPVAFKHHISPAFEHYFFSRLSSPPSQAYSSCRVVSTSCRLAKTVLASQKVGPSRQEVKTAWWLSDVEWENISQAPVAYI